MVGETGETMKAMVFTEAGSPLQARRLPIPRPGPDEILLSVKSCGVCRTDLHIYEGDLKHPKRPLILGHEIVGIVRGMGERVRNVEIGDRIGVPWLGRSCKHCPFCRTGRENLCDQPVFTGYQIDGGYAEETVADARYCFPIPDRYDDAEAAPLLCAGLIGYRSYKMTEAAKRIGIFGFGAAAHIVAQIAVYEGKEIYAFTRKGDLEAQVFAQNLGAVWVGDSESTPPEALDGAIIFAPVGTLVPKALQAVVKGGVVVCAGIHMTDIPAFSYDLLWGERVIRSVANLTRQDGIEFFEIAPKVPVRTKVEIFPLASAETALSRLKRGRIKGAAVLSMPSEKIH